MKRDFDVADIGSELVEASQMTEQSPGEVLEELFPYVYDASRRMSTRAISAWLKENHGIQISQPTISRALQKGEKYWQGFADQIEPWARRVEAEIDASMDDFLFEDDVFKYMVEKVSPSNAFEAGSDDAARYREFEDAVSILERKWFTLSLETRLLCRRYFGDMPEAEKKTEGEA
jgi:hypothetical protein